MQPEVIQQSIEATAPGLLTAVMFAVLFGLTVAGALGAVLWRNLLHAVLFLALALIGVAGIFLLLSSTFLFVVQILVYVGAVVILIIFGVMMTSHISRPRTPPRNNQALVAGLVTLGLFALTLYVLLGARWSEAAQPSMVSIEAVGAGLLQKYVLPFEIISVVLLVAMIGAIVIARKEPEAR